MLPLSAVKAVNQFDKCGYCQLCPAYMDVTSQSDETRHSVGQGLPAGRAQAARRRARGPGRPEQQLLRVLDDEKLCTGCGKCIKACKPPIGNGSLRLEIRYDLCVTCNECSILVACPETAIVRVHAPGLSPLPKEGEAQHA